MLFSGFWPILVKRNQVSRLLRLGISETWFLFWVKRNQVDFYLGLRFQKPGFYVIFWFLAYFGKEKPGFAFIVIPIKIATF